MDTNRAEALRKELDQLLRKQSKVLESRTFGAQQPTPTFWSLGLDKRSFTKCAINLQIRTRQREGLCESKPGPSPSWLVILPSRPDSILCTSPPIFRGDVAV